MPGTRHGKEVRHRSAPRREATGDHPGKNRRGPEAGEALVGEALGSAARPEPPRRQAGFS